MEVGLFGLPRSGKTTLFTALTGSPAPHGGEAHLAVVPVPDGRFDRLVAHFAPKKIVPATVQVMDLAGVAAGDGKGIPAQALAKIGTTDALCAVVRAFDDGSGLAADPRGDLENLALEMTLSDLQKVDNRLDRLRRSLGKLSGAEKTAGEAERTVLERLKPALEAGQAVRDAGLSAEEASLIRGFQFLSQKPLLVVLNVGEGADPAAAAAALAPGLAGHAGVEVLALNAAIESEIAQLESEDDRRTFLADYGLTESARDRLVQRLYGLLGLIQFFTVSEKEVHAWTIPAGTAAVEAAGAIHSDLARGFIRAEVIHVDEFSALGSLAEARRAGKLRTEGKTYIVQDGDIFHVLFSV